MHERNAFVTLTYDDEHLPQDNKVTKDELQRFIKRLRKNNPFNKFRYFACGEYGEETQRPHYHLLLFGQDFRGAELRLSDGFYSSHQISEAWPYGHNHSANIDVGSCFYVAGYVQKKRDDEASFTMKSNSLGRPYVDRFWRQILQLDGDCVIAGFKTPVPSVYIEWKEQELMAIKNRRTQLAQEKATTGLLDHIEALHRASKMHAAKAISNIGRKGKV